MRPASSRSSVSKRSSVASGDDDRRVVPLAKTMKTSSERRAPRRAARTTPLAVRQEPLTEASGLPTTLDRREEEASVLTESIDALQGLAGGILEHLASRLIGDLNHEIRNRLARAPLAIAFPEGCAA